MKTFFIGDTPATTKESRSVVNPFDDTVIEEVCLAGDQEIDHALALAARAFQTTRNQAKAERARVLDRAAGLLHRHAEELAGLIMAEAGKPISLARAEVQRAEVTFRFATQEALREDGELFAADASMAGKGMLGMVRRFPIGCILGITPFNFPLNLVAHKVAPCMASGNVMLVKPAPATPLSALRLGELLLEAGMPTGQIQVLPFDHAKVAGLMDRPEVVMLSFTGSAAVGWKLKENAGRKRVALELGGDAAAVVADDADFDKAVGQIADGAFRYAGQTCNSVQRVMVHESRYAEFKDAMVKYVTENVHTGDPKDEKVMNGPLINDATRERVREWVDEAIARGAIPHAEPRWEGPCLHPIIFENMPSTVRLGCEEAFAPVCVLSSFQTWDEALDRVNASPYGLQTGLFTQRMADIMRAYERLEVASVLINLPPAFRLDNMPYGGVKESGSGREGVRPAMEEMTEPRTLLIQPEG